jgi:hypothetical protein
LLLLLQILFFLQSYPFIFDILASIRFSFLADPSLAVSLC